MILLPEKTKGNIKFIWLTITQYFLLKIPSTPLPANNSSLWIPATFWGEVCLLVCTSKDQEACLILAISHSEGLSCICSAIMLLSVLCPVNSLSSLFLLGLVWIFLVFLSCDSKKERLFRNLPSLRQTPRDQINDDFLKINSYGALGSISHWAISITCLLYVPASCLCYLDLVLPIPQLHETKIIIEYY